MSIANITSTWVGGNLVFKKKEDGAVLLTLDAENSQVLVESLALGTKADFVADVQTFSGTSEDAALNELGSAVNAIKDAVVSAGLMEAS